MPRLAQMMDFLHQHINQSFWVESLPGDASFRRYHRIHLADNTTHLLMDAPPEKESVIEFVHVDEIMKSAINVPKIFAKDIEQGFLLLQDFGTVEFAHLITDGKTNKDNYYTNALKSLIDLQNIGIDVDLPLYDEQKLNQEMDLFIDWFLPYIKIQFNEHELNLWKNLKNQLIDNIQNQPKVIVHRDYHSRNLMQDNSIKNSTQNNSLGIIDFQDAVIGAYTYDLVSLVRDAYIDENEDWVNQKIQEFYHLKSLNIGIEKFTEQTNVMGIQRHLKVLGIFIRLYQRDGKNRYLANIPKVMNDLLQELIWLNKYSNHEIYGNFLDLLNKKVVPAYQLYFK